MIQQEKIKRHEADRNMRGGKKVNLLATEALLKFSEGDRAAIAPSNDFAIENKISRDIAKWRKQLWEFRHAVECARKDLDLRTALVDLRPDAIELVFHQPAVRNSTPQL